MSPWLGQLIRGRSATFMISTLCTVYVSNHVLSMLHQDIHTFLKSSVIKAATHKEKVTATRPSKQGGDITANKGYSMYIK